MLCSGRLIVVATNPNSRRDPMGHLALLHYADLQPSLHRHALGEVAGLVDVAAAQLPRCGRPKAASGTIEPPWAAGTRLDRAVRGSSSSARPCHASRRPRFGDGDDRPAAGLDLLEIRHDLVVHEALAASRSRWAWCCVDQRDGAVLHLGGRVAFGVNVADFLELQRPLQRRGEIVLPAQVEKIVARSAYFSAIRFTLSLVSRALRDLVRQASPTRQSFAQSRPRGSSGRRRPKVQS